MSEPKRSLLDSSRALLDTVLGLLQTRVELLAAEIEEEKVRLLSLMMYGAAAFVLFSFGLVFLSIAITVLFWDEHRLLALCSLGLVFLGCGGIALVLAFCNARPRERLFEASVTELKKDRAALQEGRHE